MPAIRPIHQPQPADSAKARLLATVMETLVGDLPPTDEEFSATERDKWVTRWRSGIDVVYGPVERPSAATNAGSVVQNVQTGSAPASATGPKLYVIKENGDARCDGQPMAFADIPITGCAFIDKRGPIEDAVFAWESVMFSDGAVKAGTPMPAGVTLVPKAPGPKVRAARSDEAEGGAFT